MINYALKMNIEIDFIVYFNYVLHRCFKFRSKALLMNLITERGISCKSFQSMIATIEYNNCVSAYEHKIKKVNKIREFILLN